MKKKTLVLIILTAICLIGAGCSQRQPQTQELNAVVLDITEYAEYFQEELKEDEFVGYVAQADFDGETYLYGLVYENPDGSYIKTPLEALIILKAEENYQLVNRCKIQSQESGGFEPPVGSGEFYNCQLIDLDGKIFIQAVEPSFSDFPVIHQILADNKDCLDFYETINGSGEIIESQGKYYTAIDNHWRLLTAEADKISYKAINLDDFHPKTSKNDVVISYLYQDGTPDNPEFLVNGSEAPILLEEYGGGSLKDPIEVPAGGKIYIYHSENYSMELQQDTLVNGEYAEIDAAVTQGVGYTAIDPRDITGKLEIFLGYYYDYWYKIPLILN